MPKKKITKAVKPKKAKKGKFQDEIDELKRLRDLHAYDPVIFEEYYNKIIELEEKNK